MFIEIMKVNILTTILLKYWFSPPLYLQGSEHVSFELLYHHDIIFWFNYSKLKDTQSNSISGKNALTIDLFLNNIKHTYGYIYVYSMKKNWQKCAGVLGSIKYVLEKTFKALVLLYNLLAVARVTQSNYLQLSYWVLFLAFI